MKKREREFFLTSSHPEISAMARVVSAKAGSQELKWVSRTQSPNPTPLPPRLCFNRRLELGTDLMYSNIGYEHLSGIASGSLLTLPIWEVIRTQYTVCSRESPGFSPGIPRLQPELNTGHASESSRLLPNPHPLSLLCPWTSYAGTFLISSSEKSVWSHVACQPFVLYMACSRIGRSREL